MTPTHNSHPKPTLEFEKKLWKGGYLRVAGIDEAGRGSWAGPVAAAAVIFKPDPMLTRKLGGVRDSKLMTPLARETWAPRIQELAECWGVGFASSAEIDRLGILPATRLAAIRALEDLHPDYLITDFLIFSELPLPQTALVRGDQRSLSAAAASVLAKTSRDAWMRAQDALHPGYGFSRHKGYGTTFHRQRLQEMGFCPLHRRSFSIPGK